MEHEENRPRLKKAGRAVRIAVTVAVIVVAMGAFLLLLGALAIYQAGYRPLASEKDEVKLGPWAGPEEVDDSRATLRVLSLNLNYGAGARPMNLEDGEFWALAPGKVGERLDAVVALGRELDVDVLLLQGVDFGSHFAGGTDQAEHLARKLKFGYLSRARMWKHPHLPYPDPLGGKMVGPVDMGLAIVSRFPLLTANRYDLPQAARENWWKSTFSPHFCLQHGKISVRSKYVHLFNSQFTSVDDDLERERQARQVAALISQESGGDGFLAGTFYAEPKRTIDIKEGRRPDYTLDLLRHKLNFQPVYTDVEALADPGKFATFSAEGLETAIWDYLLPEKGLTVGSWRTVEMEDPISPHKPIFVEFVL
jgi:endonuclease/exonuclease/phosphatase family metal-dependent hydrolase